MLVFSLVCFLKTERNSSLRWPLGISSPSRFRCLPAEDRLRKRSGVLDLLWARWQMWVLIAWILFGLVLFSMPTVLPVTEASLNYASGV